MPYCSGSTVQPTVPTSVGVYIGLDSAAAGGMGICTNSTPYIDFTILNTDYTGMLLYMNSESSFNLYVGASSGAPNMKLLTIG